MHQERYLLLKDLFSPEQLKSTCIKSVEIALGLNDDPLNDQNLVKYNFAKDNYKKA